MSFDEDDTVENVLSVPCSCSEDNADRTVYAPIRAFVPQKFWTYCPNEFLNSAIVSSHAEDAELQLLYPNTYNNTFIIPPCSRRPDFHSINSIVNSMHENVSPQIFVAMMAAGITSVLENEPLDRGSEIFWEEAQ